MLDRDFHPLSWFDEANPLGWFDRDLTSEASSSTPKVIVARPIVGAFAATLGRQLLAGAFAVHSVVGPAPRIARPQARPVVVQARPPLPRVHSVVGTPRFVNPSPVNARWTRPVVAAVHTPLIRTRSFVGAQLIPSVVAAPAPSRARAVVALVRTPKPPTRSVVGTPLPHLTLSTPSPSRARPLIVTVRTPLPKVTSFEGPQGRWFLASHERWTKPVVALVRAPRPVIRSVVGLPRPHIAPPGASRPFPRLALVRIKTPPIRTYPGSAKVQPSLFNFAIAQSSGTDSIVPGSVATGTLSQNSGIVSVTPSDSKTIQLITGNSGTVSLDSDG